MDEKSDRQFEELGTLRAEMRSEFSEMRSGMRAGFSELRAEMHAGFTKLGGEIAEVRRDLSAFQRQVTLIVAAFGVGLLGLLGAGQL